jgi:hypothetical protein
MKSKIHEYQNKYLAMSKISKIIFALMIGSMVTISCGDTKTKTTEDHGHEHDADGNHMNDEKIEQEEFQVEKDSTEIKPEIHKHEDGAEHHDH